MSCLNESNSPTGIVDSIIDSIHQMWAELVPADPGGLALTAEDIQNMRVDLEMYRDFIVNGPSPSNFPTNPAYRSLNRIAYRSESYKFIQSILDS